MKIASGVFVFTTVIFASVKGGIFIIFIFIDVSSYIYGKKSKRFMLTIYYIFCRIAFKEN